MYYHHPNRHILTDLAFSAHESLNQNTTCKGLWSSDSSIRYGSESGSEDTPHKNRFAVITSESCSLTGGLPEAISCGCAESINEKNGICPVLAHHAQFRGTTKRVVKGIVWSNDHRTNYELQKALMNSLKWKLDKPMVTMIMPKNQDSAIEIKKMILLEDIRKKDSQQNIRIPELIFWKTMQNTMLLKNTIELTDTHNFVLHNASLDVVYTGDVGLPLEGLIRTNPSLLQGLDFKSLYVAIGNLIYTYFKISQQGILHLDFKPDNIMYKIDKEGNVVFSIIDFGLLSFLENKLLDERNCTFHHIQLQDIRSMNPVETYFFEIMVHLFFDNVVKSKFSKTGNEHIRDLWKQRKQNILITSRNNIQNLFVILKNYYSNLLQSEDLNVIWGNCFQTLINVFTDEIKEKIRRDAKVNSTNQCSGVYGQCAVYDEIYIKFCHQYYTSNINEQQKNINDAGIHYDRYSLGVMILELLKARGLNNGANCTKSLSLVKSLMLRSEKLSVIYKAFLHLENEKLESNTTPLDSTPCELLCIQYRQQTQGYIPQMQQMYIPQMQMHQPQAMQQMQYQKQQIHPMQHQQIQHQHQNQPYPMQYQQQPYPMQYQPHPMQHQHQPYPMQYQHQPYPMQYQQHPIQMQPIYH